MKNNIKQIIKSASKIALCSILASSFLACDSRLEEKIHSFYDEDYYTSTNRLDMGVRGVIAPFATLQVYGQNWMVYDCDTDISHVKGSGLGHTARDIGHYGVGTENIWIENTWQQYYLVIDRANFLLENQDRIVVENTDADRKKFKALIAEARAMRALAYFDLVRLFGDVPLKEESSILETSPQIERSDIDKVYKFIVDEMEEIVDDLYWHDEKSNYVGRFSRSAGHAMLTRIYLFRGGYSLRQNGQMERPTNYKEYYTKALEHAEEVIGSTKHSLNKSYEQVFRNMCELKLEPRENIYEIQFFSTTGDNATSSNMGTYNGPEIAEGSQYGRANSFIKTHHFFSETFEDGKDLRKDVAIAPWTMTKDDQIKNLNKKKSYNWSVGKWRRNWHTGEIKNTNNTDVNWVLIRYADILLMKAEILNELENGPSAESIEAMNQVKRRGYGKDPMTPNAEVDYVLTDFNQQTLFDEIMIERARELCFEGLRRLDLIRWNKLATALATTKAKFDTAINAGTLDKYQFTGGELFTTGKHELYPIPAYDMRETGYIWEQNPGYPK